MKKIYVVPFLIFLAFSCSQSTEIATEKKLYMPEKIGRVPEGNDFNDSTSEFSYARFRETENIAAFWSKEYGDDPMANPDESRRFDIDIAMPELERFYRFYVDSLKFVEKGNSHTDSLKALLWVIGGDGGTAFGGGDEGVGMMWTPAVRMSQKPYGALAHELGHSFQYLTRANGGNGIGGGFGEMASQYMLWHVYPEWMTFENYHLEAFMDLTHLAFMHENNIYHSPYVLEYWASLRGKDVIGKMYRNSQVYDQRTYTNRDGEIDTMNIVEDPVLIYKRMFGLDQKAFNDEMFEGVRRFITWDITRVRQVAAPYANQHYTVINELDNGWYRISPEKAPQNYGYNGIQLDVPEAGTTVELDFEGIAGADGYSTRNLDSAGWRYGFVAFKADSSRVYSDAYAEPSASVSFEVPENTAHLWLVVMGAPKGHWIHERQRRRWRDTDPEPEQVINESWPYQFKLQGTVVADGMFGEEDVES